MGLSLGFEHFYKEHTAVGFTAGMIAQFNELIGDVEYGPQYDIEQAHSFFATGYSKHQIRKFSYSYGISYAVNRWIYTNYISTPDSVHYTSTGKIRMNQALGVEVSGYYLINSVVQAGVIYRPIILTLAPTARWTYQHVITLEMAFRFKTRK